MELTHYHDARLEAWSKEAAGYTACRPVTLKRAGVQYHCTPL